MSNINNDKNVVCCSPLNSVIYLNDNRYHEFKGINFVEDIPKSTDH